METKNETKTINHSLDFSIYENRAILRLIISYSLLEYSDEVSMQKDLEKREEIACAKAYDLVTNFRENFDSIIYGR